MRTQYFTDGTIGIWRVKNGKVRFHAGWNKKKNWGVSIFTHKQLKKIKELFHRITRDQAREFAPGAFK